MNFPRTTWTFHSFECGDWTTTTFVVSDEDRALEWADDFARRSVPWRVLRTDFDHETGEPESIRDVTDDLTEWRPNAYDRAHSERVADEIEILAAE